MFTVTPTTLDQVDGSVRLSAGHTTVVVSVTGPIEAKLRHELPTQASLEIVVRPSKGVAATREKVMEDYLRLVLQLVIVRYKYPRQLIQIVVQFLTSDSDVGDVLAYSGNELCAAVNGCFFALADAKVALYESFAAVALAPSENGIDVFPLAKQLPLARSHHAVAFGIREKRAHKLLLVDSHGTFTEDELVHVIEKASRVCEKIHRVQRLELEAGVQRDFVWAHDE